MCPRSPVGVKFVEGLFSEDTQIAEAARLRGCPRCGGRLHRADYPRKVRGVAEAAECFFAKRFSFCCGSCRKRLTPESVRFLGRRVYAEIAVLWAGLLAAAASVSAAARWAGAAPRTLRRWRRWFQGELPASGFWEQHVGRLRVPPLAELMPGSLIDQFQAQGAERLLLTMRFLQPLTSNSAGQQF